MLRRLLRGLPLQRALGFGTGLRGDFGDLFVLRQHELVVSGCQCGGFPTHSRRLKVIDAGGSGDMFRPYFNIVF